MKNTIAILTLVVVSVSCNFVSVSSAAIQGVAGSIQGDAGQGGYFNRLGGSVRSQGMSNAYSAVGEDPSAIFYNPASLAMLNRKEFIGEYAILFEEAGYNTLSFGWPVIWLKPWNWALSYSNISSPLISVYDSGGNLTGEKVVASDTLLMFGNSFTIFTRGPQTTLPFLSVGVNAKIFMKSFDKINTNGFGIDAGVYSMPLNWLRLGYSAINLVKPSLTYNGRSDVYPMGQNIGIVIDSGWVMITMDTQMYGTSTHYNFGAEIRLYSISLRGGYGSALGPSFGVGLGLPGGLTFDYAALMHTDLGWSHRMGASWKFGKDKEAFVLHGEVVSLLNAGKQLVLSGKLKEATSMFKQVFKKDEENASAKQYLEEIQKIQEDEIPPVIEGQKKLFVNTLKGNVNVVATDDIAIKQLVVNGKTLNATELVTKLSLPYPVAMTEKQPKTTLKIKAVDVKNHIVTKDMEVNVDKDPPSILIEEPDKKTVTVSEERIKLVFAIEDAGGVREIKINKVPLPEVKDVVEREHSLAVGLNKVEIEVTDNAGNIAKETLNVTREYVKIRMALLSLAGKAGVSAQEAEMISDSVRVGISSTRQFKLLERSEMDKVLQQEKFEEAMGCSDEKCAAKAGQLLKVDKMGFGYVHKMGEMYIITLRIIDSKTGEIDAYVTDRTTNKSELLDLGERVGKTLVDKYLGK